MRAFIFNKTVHNEKMIDGAVSKIIKTK